MSWIFHFPFRLQGLRELDKKMIRVACDISEKVAKSMVISFGWPQFIVIFFVGLQFTASIKVPYRFFNSDFQERGMTSEADNNLID